MKALDITIHKTNLTNILIDIFKNSFIGPLLGFKGGTAALLFYNLPRFSVDLDFDLIVDFKKDVYHSASSFVFTGTKKNVVPSILK